MRKAEWRALLGLAAAALMLFALVKMTLPGGSSPVGTEDDYVFMGDRLVHHFQLEGRSCGRDTVSWHLPAYQVLRGLVNEWGVPERAFNAACLIAIFLLLLADGLLLGGGACALLAGFGLLLIYRSHQFDFHDVQHFYCALVLIVAGLIIRRAKAPSLKATLLLALALGASLACRSTLVLFPPALVLSEWLLKRPRPQGYRRHAAVLLVTPYLFLIPWTRMNWRLHRELVLLEYGQADGNVIPGALGFVGTPEATEGDMNVLPARPLRHGEVLGWAIGDSLRHPARYLAGYARRVALAVSWGPLLFALGVIGFWRVRSKSETAPLALLALYFLVMYCTMTIQPQYFKPLWLLLWLSAARWLSSALARPTDDASRWSLRLAEGATSLGLAGAVSLAGYAMWLVATYVDGAMPVTVAGLDAAIAKDPADPCLRYERGLLRLKGDGAGADEDFKTAARLNPSEARYWSALAVLQGRWSGPVPEHPHDRGDMLLLQAQTELRRGRLPEARRTIDAAMSAYDEALYLRGRPRGEEEAILRRMHAVSADANFLHGVYGVLLTAITPQEALALVREIDRARPGQPAVLLEQARLAQQAGDQAAAQELEKRLRKLSQPPD